jgi:hypothetical protein
MISGIEFSGAEGRMNYSDYPEYRIESRPRMLNCISPKREYSALEGVTGDQSSFFVFKPCFFISL